MVSGRLWAHARRHYQATFISNDFLVARGKPAVVTSFRSTSWRFQTTEPPPPPVLIQNSIQGGGGIDSGEPLVLLSCLPETSGCTSLSADRCRVSEWRGHSATLFHLVGPNWRVRERSIAEVCAVKMGEDGTSTPAELFERGRFSEILTAYTEDGDHDEPQKAVYTACNRAAAKLGLEMFRACIRDLDEAIKRDAFCLRAYLLKGKLVGVAAVVGDIETALSLLLCIDRRIAGYRRNEKKSSVILIIINRLNRGRLALFSAPAVEIDNMWRIQIRLMVIFRPPGNLRALHPLSPVTTRRAYAILYDNVMPTTHDNVHQFNF